MLNPVLPIHSRANLSVPFLSAEELLKKQDSTRTELWQYAVWYESQRGNIPEEEVFQKMNALVDIMENAVAEGLKGTNYADRILGPQAHLIAEKKEKNLLIPCDILNEVIQDITAIMETKSSMGVIVAAPTAGSCACREPLSRRQMRWGLAGKSWSRECWRRGSSVFLLRSRPPLQQKSQDVRQSVDQAPVWQQLVWYR